MYRIESVSLQVSHTSLAHLQLVSATESALKSWLGRRVEGEVRSEFKTFSDCFIQPV